VKSKCTNIIKTSNYTLYIEHAFQLMKGLAKYEEREIQE
jgi:hypothetical protein